ncbi:MAG: McrB family protein, partial [Saprospiraceae bacterium]
SLKVNIPGTNFEATQIQYQAFLNIIKMRNAVEEPLVDYQKTKNRTKHPLNLILYGAPGTGKTYHTVNYALSIIEDISLKQLEKEPRGHLLQRFQSYQLEGQIQVVTFHQSFSYEDFIEGIKPQTTDDQQVIYNIEDGIFKNMAQKAANHPHKDRYVLIIDEINRGNVAAIFGELITLIEPEKRIGSLEKVTIQLPYSKIPFAVPSNLYLIGTMNTADRNTEILDNALRRRFDFIEKSPVPSLLTTIETIDLSKLLTVINQRIEILLDRDHVIGHAYLMSVQNISGLQQVFATKIIPLLQEYFYGDWSKIGLILGQHFIKSEYINASSGVFADFDDDGKGDYDGKTIYSVTDRKSWNKETFVSIYE